MNNLSNKSCCLVVDCLSPVKAKGLCNKHWSRQHKGKPLTEKSRFEKTDEELFWERVSIAGKNECWLWTAGKKGKPDLMYGSFWASGKNHAAHRFSYVLANGEIPQGGDCRGMCVCHSCDNPLCVNPKHLFIGTHTDNMRDKINKGRCGQANKTHCPHGHKYSAKNTYITKRGLRMCRMCGKERERVKRGKLMEQRG